MSKDLIKNKLEVRGSREDVHEVMEFLRKNNFSFEKIKGIEGNPAFDEPMNEETCYALSAYMEKESEVDQEMFLKTCTFVGRTRKVPYKFNLKNSNESNEKAKRLYKHGSKYVELIKNKTIFNGYMLRDAAWGTGSEAFDISFKGNRVEFSTWYKAPIRIVETLGLKFPSCTFIYEYRSGTNLTQIKYRGASKEVLRHDNVKLDEINAFSLIRSNASI